MEGSPLTAWERVRTASLAGRHDDVMDIADAMEHDGRGRPLKGKQLARSREVVAGRIELAARVARSLIARAPLGDWDEGADAVHDSGLGMLAVLHLPEPVERLACLISWAVAMG